MPAFPTAELREAMQDAFPEFRPRIQGNDRITFVGPNDVTIVLGENGDGDGFTWITGDGGRVEGIYIAVQISGHEKFNTRADNMDWVMKEIRTRLLPINLT